MMEMRNQGLTKERCPRLVNQDFRNELSHDEFAQIGPPPPQKKKVPDLFKENISARRARLALCPIFILYPISRFYIHVKIY
jgi:hypothetical protein